MKKIIAALCLVCMMTLLIIPASANDYKKYGGDSSDIPEEALALLPLEEGDTVIRVYHAYTYGFLKYNIEELIESRIIRIYYVVLSTDGTCLVYYIKDGCCVKEQYQDGRFHTMLDTYLSRELVESIDPNIIVESIYYLHAAGGEPKVIYYETNLGDYAYLYLDRAWPYAPELGEFFLSAEALCEYIRIRTREHEKYNEMVEGRNGCDLSYTPEYKLDLSAYQIGSPNFDPNAPFPVPKDNESHGTLWLIGGIALALVLAAAATWFFLRRRKNALLFNETESI